MTETMSIQVVTPNSYKRKAIVFPDVIPLELRVLILLCLPIDSQLKTTITALFQDKPNLITLSMANKHLNIQGLKSCTNQEYSSLPTPYQLAILCRCSIGTTTHSFLNFFRLIEQGAPDTLIHIPQKVQVQPSTILTHALYEPTLILAEKLIQHNVIELHDCNALHLSIACRRGHVNLVRAILLRQSNLNVCGEENMNIVNALKSGNKDLVSVLLKDVRVRPCFQQLVYPAAEYGCTEAFKVLLESGDVNVADCVHNPLLVAIRNGHDGVVELLLDHDGTRIPSTCIEIAVENYRHNILDRLLSHPRVDQVSKAQYRLMHYTLLQEWDHLLEVLANPLVNPSVNDNFIMLEALRCTRFDVVERLCQHPLTDFTLNSYGCLLPAVEANCFVLVGVILLQPQPPPFRIMRDALWRASMEYKDDIVELFTDLFPSLLRYI
ncbi:hypothetical protein HDU79_002539 [Rhizoclosmatium sp. JEL0117]|nr:hypothetical protein HDU79_002539 [Rhizoclosmatium sp. JEL0117]